MPAWKQTLILILCTLLWLAPVAPARADSEAFAAWLTQLRSDALAAGVSAGTLDTALAGVHAPESQVLEKDRTQPEQIISLRDYVRARVTDERIAEGRAMLHRYRTWLGRIEKQYGVQKRFLVALWGIESSYGRHPGERPVIASLVTLAYDDRRGDYFRKELLTALQILDQGHVSLARMHGSWAGAMGPFQFMPSSFLHYAVDADGDGRKDIWGSVPDALASAANYLAKARWQKDQTWGRGVTLPKPFDAQRAGLGSPRSLAGWQQLGVRRSDGRALPQRRLSAALIIPDGPQGPAFLVYDNFRVLLRWNRSHAFAVTVGSLADCYGEPGTPRDACRF